MERKEVYMYKEEYDKLIKQNKDMRRAICRINRSFVLHNDTRRLYQVVGEELDDLWRDHGQFWEE